MERRIATARCENETGFPWPISLCKLEAGNSSTQIETGAHLRAAVTAKNTKIELVCNNRWGLIIFRRTIYLILRDSFKIQMDKSLLVKWNIQTKNVLYNSGAV